MGGGVWICEIIHSLGALCVPFFFVISGYLFFRTFKLEDYCKKIDTRRMSLFVPYLIWNALATLQSMMGEHLCLMPSSEKDTIDWIIACLNADCSILWYVKYLLYFAVLSPCIYYFIKTPKRAFVTFAFIALSTAYCIVSGKLQIPIPVSANTVPNFCYNIEYFLVGAIAALHLRDFVENPPSGIKYPAWIFVIAFIAERTLDIDVSLAITQWIFIFAVIGVWFALDVFKFKKANRYAGLSFFIYCLHSLIYFPLLGIFPKLSSHPEIQFIINCCIPIFISLLCIGIGDFMRRYTPKTFLLLNGGRD